MLWQESRNAHASGGARSVSYLAVCLVTESRVTADVTSCDRALGWFTYINWVVSEFSESMRFCRCCRTASTRTWYLTRTFVPSTGYRSASLHKSCISESLSGLTFAICNSQAPRAPPKDLEWKSRRPPLVIYRCDD